jgi:hypothetical protein
MQNAATQHRNGSVLVCAEKFLSDAVAGERRKLEKKDSLSFPHFECLRQHRLTGRRLLNQEFCDAIVVEQQGKV